MLQIFIIQKIINFCDFFQQRKIFSFLKKKINKNAVLFDVGAHYGETIENFKKNFNFSEIHSFEASIKNFNILSEKYKEHNNKVIINNFGLSDKNKELIINQFAESSSSTLSKINEKSRYFKRKMRILGLKENDKNYYQHAKVKLDLLDNYLKQKDINKVDLLKIDTEGHEYFVIKGSLSSLPKINYIYFEHHYDDMLDKKYTFSEIHKLLISNNFKKVFKSKMFFRKTFEYIYENSKFN